MKRIFLNGLLIFFCFVAKGAWGDVGFNLKEPGSNGGPALLMLLVTKTITPDDYANVVKMASLLQPRFHDKWKVLAKLDSTGGNVSAALKIGRFLRSKGAMAFIDEGAVCLSSCVYILAGAAYRAVSGQVGIHRPYEPNDQEISAAAQKDKYKKIEKDIVAYLQEMNIPKRLYDDSLFISPDRIKMLTANELQGYGLNVNDPYADEARTVTEAKKLGISRKEYAARKARSQKECDLDSVSNETPKDKVISALNCQDAILEGRR